VKLFSRLLLAFSAIVLVGGAYLHTSGFNRMSAAVAKSDLVPFVGKGLKVLWLQDSVIAIVLGIIFGTIAARGSAAPRWIIVVLGLIPAATAGFVYHFIGNFIGGHVFLTAGVAAILGGTFVSRKRTGLTAFKRRTGL
jgi:hypothetical protein